MHRAVAGFSLTALDVTQLGQRQGRVASLLLAENEMETTNSAVIQFVDLTTSDDDHRAVSFILVQ